MDEQKYNLDQSLAELDKLVDLSAEVTDKTACEALAEKARIIYEQYPESEDIALRYAMVLYNLSNGQNDIKERKETISELEILSLKFQHSKDIALRYAMALFNLSNRQNDIKERIETISELESLTLKFQHSEDIVLQYANALFNHSNLQNDIKERIETISELERLTLKFQHSEDIALRYAMALVNLATEQLNVEELGNIANLVKQMFEQFKHSEDIALQYAMALVNLSAEQINVEELGKTVNSVKQMFEQFKQSEDIALRYAMILYNLSNMQNDIKERKETISELERLTLKFQHSEDIALRYAMALVNLATEQLNVEELGNIANLVKQMFEQFKHSEDIALQYAMALVNLSAEQINVEELGKTVNSVKQMFEQFKHSEDIALQYTTALVNLSTKQTKAEEIAETTQKIKDIYKKFNEPQDIALRYAIALFSLSLKQTNLDKLNNIASKLKKIAYNFAKNEDITLCYAEVLTKIITKQQNEDEKLEIIDKLKRLHNRFVQSEEITVKYLTARMDLVKNNQIDQSNLLNDIYQSLESIPSIKILNMLIEILENEEQFEQEQAHIPTNNIIKALDQICFDSSIEEEKSLLIRTLKLDIISDTKYDIIKAWIERYGDEPEKINKLIKIYTLVQQLKYELGLKDADKSKGLKFGHYTSGRVLQSILGKKDNIPFSISGKTRLNNANYMNDPEEGVILEEILKLEKRNPLEPSSWFLMSFTSKTDDLAMWSQYGNNAEGVCIVLKEDDFARYHSLSDLPWYQKNSDKQISHKMNSDVEIPNDISLNESGKEMTIIGNENVQISEGKHSISNNNRDYLYRVAYVHYSDDQFDIEKTELFTSEEVTRLKGLLEDLKSELRDYKNSGDPFYKKAIGDCIEEIRYLFKSVDYKYEEELRILQYANLRSDNSKIKIDYSPEFGKLYLERKENIQIDKIIFGPKFPNPEYVTPLLKLLDKEIKYKKSTIKFR